MSKTIVTHISPDFDASCAAWLIQKFLPGWKDAIIAYVPAGSTLENKPVDENKEIIHVDTGLGQFDHHQTNEYTSAAKLVFDYLVKNEHILSKQIEPVERIINFVTDIDHFGESNFPDATNDRYDFGIYQVIEGLKPTLDKNELLPYIFNLFDAELQIFKNKVKAEEELKKGLIFQSKWGKCIALETKNEETVKLALKIGFSLVVRKDPEKGNARIKTLPEKKYDLSPVYQKLIKIDPKATWFLHVSKNMLLNSSSKNPTFIPTSLSLQRLIETIKGV